MLALASALTVLAAPAAAEPTASEIGVARRLFDEGKAAEDSGQFRVAADKFRRAASIKDTPGIRFHLARCEEEQGAFVEALLEYDRARELLDGGIKAADVEKLLPAARERVRSKVALLTVKLPEGVSNATVELDGKMLSGSVLGVPMPINPGKHRVTAASAGRANFNADLELANGEVRQLPVELPVTNASAPTLSAEPAPAAEPSAPRAASTKRSVDGSAFDTRTVVLLSEATLFAAGLTTGLVFTVVRSGASDRYQSANEAVLADPSVGGADPDGVACSGDNRPDACADLIKAGQDRSRATNFATAGFVTAGVSAAAFGLTYWLWPTAPASARAAVVPGGLSVSVSGRF